MDVRLVKNKKTGEIILQKYTGVGQNKWGRVVFGWVDAETIVQDRPEATVVSRPHRGTPEG